MTQTVELPLNKIVCSDILVFLKTLPDDCIDMVITSPPYWGLRDYGEQTKIVWSGREDCQHDFNVKYKKPRGGGDPVESTRVGNNRRVLHFEYSSHFCSKCGAWRGALGLEPTFQLYIDHLLEVFREVYRVLKPTGAFYLNIGDCSSKTGAHIDDDKQTLGKSFLLKSDNSPQLLAARDAGLPAKCLVNIPERLAIRMMDEQGWVQRNKIIWHKPNHMPESTQDNLTSSWEYIYFFVKNTERPLLWRNRKTKQWVSEKPTQKYFDSKGEYDACWWKCRGGFSAYGQLVEPCDSEGGDWKSRLKHVKETKAKGLKHIVKGPRPLWLGFHYYYDLDAIRVPNKVMGVTDKRPPGILRQKLYRGSQERYGSSGDLHLTQFTGGYQGKFEGVGDAAEKYGSPQTRTQRKLGASDVFPDEQGRVKTSDGEWRQGGMRPPPEPGYGYEPKEEGKNPGDVMSEEEYRKWYFGEREPHGWHDHEADAEMGLTHQKRGHRAPHLPHPDGKHPDDIVEASPETRSLGAIIGEKGAVKVPGGKGWTGHVEGGGARIMREQDPRWLPPDGKNLGDFWEIVTEAYKGGHFAAFPLAICFDPILASCPPDDGVVLDPFAGTGTVAEAVELLNIYGKKPTPEQVKQARTSETRPLKPAANRKWIMVELNPKYAELAEKRLAPYAGKP